MTGSEQTTTTAEDVGWGRAPAEPTSTPTPSPDPTAGPAGDVGWG
ncbi:hypothetical protein [Streptomyces roseolus]